MTQPNALRGLLRGLMFSVMLWTLIIIVGVLIFGVIW